MLGDLGNFLQVALTVLTLSSLAGLGLMRGTVVNLRENLADARAEIADKDRRVADLETEYARERSDREAQSAALHVQVEKQKVALEELGRQVRGDEKLGEISSKLDAHSGEARVHWLTVEELLRELLKGILDLLKRSGK